MATARTVKKKKSTTAKRSRLTRVRAVMPARVRRTLLDRGAMAAYRARPAYQRNDYLRWITAAKQQVTRDRRLEQMVVELKRGNVYMKMAWHAERA